MADQGVTMRFDRIRAALGEGEFVLVVSEDAFAEKTTAKEQQDSFTIAASTAAGIGVVGAVVVALSFIVE